MSAFVVDTDTMNRCVRGILTKGRYSQVIRRFMDIETDAKDAGTLIGRRLFTLNIEAVQQRYPDTLDSPNNMPGPIDKKGNSTALKLANTYRYRETLRPATLAALVDSVKALQCLRYQCSEGDVDKRPEFAALSEAIAELSEHIVESLPEYEMAAWG